ncbi:MAG: BatA domain-containing protein, partial [Candidatus Marinimicrobia bacterium]|nr:BatA domain-containing protein [Candidatus Neomarinimicrobiota bacterium]
MSFLLPQMLWALPAVSLPLLIHLLSRANTKVVDFSSLRFLTLIEHNSMRRLNWNQWLLVLIRSLLLLFFILLLARPVVRGYFRGFLEGSATTLTVCLVDDSFSMSGITGSDNNQGRGALA